jgi:pinin/SDK/memA/ protein conserved region
VVPEAPEATRTASPTSPPNPNKRRPSDDLDGPDSKRRQGSGAEIVEKRVVDDSTEKRRATGKLEERKRGQRLFGALLGTLSHSTNSSARKRREDVEKKQQARLKLQSEALGEKKKIELEKLTAVRAREQRHYDRQAVGLRKNSP